MAEINGLLNRHRALKLYRGFESLPHRNELPVIGKGRQPFCILREVAQPGSAPGLGPGGRRFESCLPDKTNKASGESQGFFVLKWCKLACINGKTKKPCMYEVQVEALYVLGRPHFRISVANPVFVWSHASLYIKIILGIGE